MEPAKGLTTIGNIRVTIPLQPENINSEQLFTRTGLLYDFDKKLVNRIRKGDLVSYEGHVSIVYSDRANCTTDNDGKTTCTYEIIHAYGVTPYVYPGTTERIFSRKVIKTREDIGVAPTGFGRIKLWD